MAADTSELSPRAPTCDWGDDSAPSGYCDEPAFGFALDHAKGWLVICHRHYREASAEGYHTRADVDPVVLLERQ